MKFAPSMILSLTWWTALVLIAQPAAQGRTPLAAATVWLGTATLLIIGSALALVATATAVEAVQGR